MIARFECLKPGPRAGFLVGAPRPVMPFLAPLVAWGGALDFAAAFMPDAGSNPAAVIVPATNKNLFPISGFRLFGAGKNARLSNGII